MSTVAQLRMLFAPEHYEARLIAAAESLVDGVRSHSMTADQWRGVQIEAVIAAAADLDQAYVDDGRGYGPREP